MRLAPIATVAFVAFVAVASLGGCGGGAAGDDVVGAYLEVGSSLAKDDVTALSELGAKLTTAAKAKAGEPGIEAVSQGAGALAGTDLSAARTAFETMSMGMIEYLRAHPDQRTGYTIVHCPMAFGGKGALWVQEEGKVQNPYEGSRMPTCGDKLGWSAELPQT